MGKFAASIERPKAKNASASGGFALWPSDPWTPLGALPHTPVIGSRYRAHHGAVLPQILLARTATASSIVEDAEESLITHI